MSSSKPCRLALIAFVESHQFERAAVRAAKIGREINVEIAFQVPADFGKVRIDELDAIRNEVRENLNGLGYNIWMNVLFTRDKSWV